MSTESVKSIAHCHGLSGQIMFAMDTESEPANNILHFVRLETIKIPKSVEFDQSTLLVLHPEADPRLACLAQCFTEPHTQAAIKLLRLISLALGALTAVATNNSILTKETRAIVNNALEVIHKSFEV